MNSKQWLQAVNAVLSLIPIGTGVVTMMGVADPIYAGLGIPDTPMLDGNLRFFGGVWLVLGLTLARVIPTIDTRSAEFQIIWIAVFVGGIGRLLSMAFSGIPPLPFIGFTVIEIVGAPLLLLWQHSVARQSAARKSALRHRPDH